jgi:glycogen(starch) synthase
MGIGIGTVFTTHATVLGRSFAFNNIDFYKDLKKINAEEAARNFGVYPKHSLEKTVALNCSVLTTVSDITADEAGAFFGRRPEVILPNGLDFSNFPNTEEATFRHTDFKRILKEFLMYFFFPYYKFNLDKTLMYFLVGRFEMHAKGIDLYIDALGELNKKLKNQNSDKTIIAFVAVPTAAHGVKPELIQSKAVYQNIRQSIDAEMPNIYNRLVRACSGEFEVNGQNILKHDLRNHVFSKIKLFKRTGDPLLTTHMIDNESNDAIINRFKAQGLFNREEDKVKVIYFPVYLNGADGLLNTNLYDFIAGAHLGIFPSFYEPWGYTPLEAGALGVASVTTDLSGFGLAVNALGGRKKFPGTYVLERSKFDYKKEAKELAALMYKYSTFNKDERLISRIHANQTARNFDWKILVRNYFEAHELALAQANLKAKE